MPGIRGAASSRGGWRPLGTMGLAEQVLTVAIVLMVILTLGTGAKLLFQTPHAVTLDRAAAQALENQTFDYE